ncbi:MAG: hypothetical protein AB7E08_05920, partial [Candidatus Omnitrophota bacterium]
MERKILLFLVCLGFLIFSVKVDGYQGKDLFGPGLFSSVPVGQIPAQVQTSPLGPISLIPQTDRLHLTEQISEYALETLNYFINPELGLDERTGLVHNYIYKRDDYTMKANFTSITDIGLQ